MKSEKNIFSLYLTGQLSLPVAFWGGFVGSSVCLYIFSLWAFSKPTAKYIFDTFGGEGYKLFILLYYAILLVWTAIIIIGTWRSAKNYEGHYIWPTIVKFILAINILQFFIIIPKTFNEINEAIYIVNNHGIISLFSTKYDSKKEIDDKNAVRKMIYTDAIRVLNKNESSKKSIYTSIKDIGFSHEKVRGLIRPVLEVNGLSAQQIDDYFSFYDSSYHGGADIRLKENKRLVDSLLN